MEEKIIRVHPIGSQVRVRDTSIKAMITQIALRDINCRDVAYELSYWSSGEKKSSWCHDFEFEVASPSEMERIGFQGHVTQEAATRTYIALLHEKEKVDKERDQLKKENKQLKKDMQELLNTGEIK